MPNVKLNSYELVGGQFIGLDYTAEPVPVLDADGNPLLDRKTKKPLAKLPSKKFAIGETVVSPFDLAARSAGQFKFKGPYAKTIDSALLPPSGVAEAVKVSESPAKPVTPTPAPTPFYTEDELNEMTVADLRKLAEEEEIEIPASVHLKAEVVKAILAAKK